MRLLPYCALLAARDVLLACGYTLRGKDGQVPADMEPPMVNAVKNDLQINTADHRISALKLKTLYATNNAQAAAAQANTARIHVEELFVKTKNIMPELDAIKATAKSQANSANEQSKDAIALAKTAKEQMPVIINDAKVLAVTEVKELLKQKYKELSEWRHQVLNNPWEKGQVAGAKAAKQYFAMMGNFAGTSAAIGLESGAMKSQAASDAANAQSLAAGVDAKKKAGDPIGAAQDDEMAKALEIQSQQLAARGAALDGQIADMSKVVPEFATHAHLAAWNAEYAQNPDGLPPPPIDPNFAFTPAPPKLGAPAPAP